MAKNEVIMRFKIQDDGSLKAVGQKAEKAGKNLEKTAKGAHSTDRQLKGAAQASSNTTKNFSKMSQGISGGLVPAYATLAATMFAVTAVFRGLEQAFNWKAQAEGLAMFADTSGIAMQSLVRDMREATGGLLNFKEAAQAAQIGLASGLTPDDLKGLAEGAKLVSGALGRDLEDSFNRLVRGVTKAEPELLDELGIVLRLDIATRKYAAANGLLQSQLTLTQRMQAVNTEVQSQLNDKFGEFADRADELMNPFTKLQTAFTDLTKDMSEMLLPPLVAIAEFLSENTEAAALLMAGFAASILRSAFPALKTLSASMIEFGKTSKKNAILAQKDFKKASKAYKIAKQDWSASDIVHQTKFKKILKKMGIDQKMWLDKTVVNQERSIAMMLRNEKKKNAKVKLLAKGELEYLRKVHGQIAASHQTMTNKMIAGSNAAATGMTAAMAKAGAASSAILVGMGKLAERLAPTFAFLGTAMGWLFGVATAVFIGKFIWDWAKGTGVFNKEATELDKTWDSVLDKLTEIDKIQNSNINNIKTAVKHTKDYNDALVKQFNIWGNLSDIKMLQQSLGMTPEGETGPTPQSREGVTKFFSEWLGTALSTGLDIGPFLDQFFTQMDATANATYQQKFTHGMVGQANMYKEILGSVDFSEGGDQSKFQDFINKLVPVLMENVVLAESLGLSLKNLAPASTLGGEKIKNLRTELENLANVQSRIGERFKANPQQQMLQAVQGTIAEAMRAQDADEGGGFDFYSELDKKGVSAAQLGIKKDASTSDAIKQLQSTERILKLSHQLSTTMGTRVARAKQLGKLAAKLGDSHGKQQQRLFQIAGLEAESETLLAGILQKRVEMSELGDHEQENAMQQIANDMIKIENLGVQIELLQQQDQLMTQIRDKAIQAFDSAGQSQLKDLITGKEGSGTDAIKAVATSTLQAMAGVLSEKMMAPITGKFKELLGVKDPIKQQEDIFNDHIEGLQTALEEHIKGISATGTGKRLNEETGEMEDIITKGAKGSLEDITNILGKKDGGGFLDSIMSMFKGLFGGGDWLSSIFSLFGFGAKGGMVRRYAGGTGPAGAQYVPGTGNRDTVPAMLTPGEIVVPKGKRVGGNYNTTVNVNMEGGGDVTTDDEAAAAFGQVIQIAVTEEIANQQLPGGLLSPFGGGSG